jgi:hypothetical protein
MEATVHDEFCFLKYLNQVESVYVTLGGGSAFHKEATCTQNKQNIKASTNTFIWNPTGYSRV